MNLKAKLFNAILLIAFSTIFSNVHSEDAKTVQDYFDHLKEIRYNPQIPPDGFNGPGSTVRVLATMYLLDIHNIDDYNMDYRAQFYFRQSWNDSRLAHPDSSDIIINDINYIWTPDLFFVQEKEGIRHNLNTPNVFIKIKSNGEVHYSTRLTLTFTCPMKFHNFPHDIQKCQFRIESYGRISTQMELSWDHRVDTPVSKADKINVLPFDLTAIENSVQRFDFQSAQYTALVVDLTFERNQGFFMTRLYVPFIILVALAWLSFWIKSKMVALRVSLLFVILYLMINLGTNITGYIPPAPYTKASDVWIATCESFVFAAFLEFILVSILSKSEKKYEKKRTGDSCDPEAPMINEPIKEIKCVHSDKIGSSICMMASRLSKDDTVSRRIDVLATILYPVLFLIFNLIYWVLY